MARGSGELRRMIKPDGDHVWEGFEAIESLIGYLVAPDR